MYVMFTHGTLQYEKNHGYWSEALYLTHKQPLLVHCYLFCCCYQCFFVVVFLRQEKFRNILHRGKLEKVSDRARIIHEGRPKKNPHTFTILSCPSLVAKKSGAWSWLPIFTSHSASNNHRTICSFLLLTAAYKGVIPTLSQSWTSASLSIRSLTMSS